MAIDCMPDTTQLLWYILIIGAVGVAALLLGILAARFVKKRLQSTPSAEAFSIQDLRGMHERGEINTQEYEAMRAAIIAQATAPPPAQARPDAGNHETGQQPPDLGPDLPDVRNHPPTEDSKDH